MKRLSLVFMLSLFYLAACTNGDTHSHDDHTHSHDGHSHSHDGAHDHSHDHAHEQEEFTVETDTLQQDSTQKHQ